MITKILASARQLINEAHTISLHHRKYALKRTKIGKAEPASAKMKKKKEEKIIQEKAKEAKNYKQALREVKFAYIKKND